MARNINGFVGTYSSIAELSTKFPPSEYVGCNANIGTAVPYQKAWCDGTSWGAVTSAQLTTLNRTTRRTDALVKVFGPTDASGYTFAAPSGSLNFDWNTSIKQEVEAPFSAVRLVVWNRRNAALNFKGLVGVTETSSNADTSYRTVPRISGVFYPQLAPGVTVQGFKKVTFAGADQVTLGAASTSQTIAVSDRIPLASVPRVSGEASTRPLLLSRAFSNGFTAAVAPWVAATPWMPSNLALSAASPLAVNGNRVYAQSGTGGQPGADYIASPIAIPDNATPNACLEYGQIISFNVPVLSVWGVGDSITNLPDAITQSTFINSWGMRACAEVSTPERPVVWANMGAPVAGAAKYLALARQYLAAGCPAPSVLVVNPVSANDDSSNWVTAGQYGMTQSRDWALDSIRLAREYNIPYIIWFPLLPRETSPGGAASDALRKQLNAEMRVIAAANGITFLDFSALSDGAALEFFYSKYDYGDGLHQNELANTEVLVPKLAAILRTLL